MGEWGGLHWEEGQLGMRPSARGQIESCLGIMGATQRAALGRHQGEAWGWRQEVWAERPVHGSRDRETTGPAQGKLSLSVSSAGGIYFHVDLDVY